jgi:TonB family protein
MRRILVASLMLVPMFLPAAAVASQSAGDSSASTPARPLSTGVTLPKIVYTTDVSVSPDTFDQLSPSEAKVVLSLAVDAQGKAQNVQVVNSVNSKLDEHVIDAVRQFRWRPGTLDHQPVPVDLNLIVYVRR